MVYSSIAAPPQRKDAGLHRIEKIGQLTSGASPRETTSLIAPSKPTFYPQAKIDLQHNQLKHRISTRDSEAIYFCSGFEIYALYTSIQRRELVKSLSWEPKCLDAGYGWICVGANDGQCAFIRIANSQDDHSRSGLRQHAAAVDELLPVDLDPTSRSYITRELQFLRSTSSNIDKYDLRYHTLGKDIVNSVVVHKMKSMNKGFEDEIVVITTNNDKTVQIYSLSQSKPLVTITYVTQMNHASMSPDGNLILAVGDKGQAFFHKRIPFENSSVGDKAFMTYGWIAVGEPLLRQISDIDACFSTGFSPSGHRCIVASEGGIITIFDTNMIKEEMEGEDAVVCVMKTSRPSIRPELTGAARSTTFSPSPWDLLAVAEDQGRVIVLDLRSPEFLFRQTLELSVDPTDVVLAECSNSRLNTQTTLEQRQHDIERRLLESRREAAELQERFTAVANSTDELEHTTRRQNIQADLIGLEVQGHVENAGESLSESTRQMVDALGLGRSHSHNEPPSSSTTAGTSVNTAASSNRHNVSSLYSTLLSSNNRSTEGLTARQNLSRAAVSLLEEEVLSSGIFAGRDHPSRSSASIAEHLHQRNIERERQRNSDRQPRRRSSVVIMNSNSRNANNSHSTLAPIGTATPTISTSPSRIPSSRSSGSPAPPINSNESMSPAHSNITTATPETWQPLTDDVFTNSSNDSSRDALAEASAIVAHARRQNGLSTLRRSASVTRSLGTSGTTTDPRLNQQATQSVLSRADLAVLQRTRDRVASRIRDLGQETTTIHDLSQSHAGGVVVQGVGWSQNGRSLFVATENGMLEYNVNIRERMQWPGVGFL